MDEKLKELVDKAFSDRQGITLGGTAPNYVLKRVSDELEPLLKSRTIRYDDPYIMQVIHEILRHNDILSLIREINSANTGILITSQIYKRKWHYLLLGAITCTVLGILVGASLMYIKRQPVAVVTSGQEIFQEVENCLNDGGKIAKQGKKIVCLRD